MATVRELLAQQSKGKDISSKLRQARAVTQDVKRQEVMDLQRQLDIEAANMNLGRTAGMTGATLLAGLLTGGMSLPLQAAIIGGASGLGSIGGQGLASSRSGMGDIREQTEDTFLRGVAPTEKQAREQMLRTAGTDALMSGITAGAGSSLGDLFGGVLGSVPMGGEISKGLMSQLPQGLQSVNTQLSPYIAPAIRSALYSSLTSPLKYDIGRSMK